MIGNDLSQPVIYIIIDYRRPAITKSTYISTLFLLDFCLLFGDNCVELVHMIF